MRFLQRFAQKIRYNNPARLVTDALTKVGVRISPFYLVVEGLSQIIPEFEQDKFCDFTIDFLTEKDIEQIVSDFREKGVISEEKLLKRFRNGAKCLGAKKNGKIAAYTWFNTDKCEFSGCPFLLNRDEAYLFDAYTLVKYRGEKIAQYLRYRCYKELKSLGKTRLYSISEAFNRQSMNFKKRLNARFIFFGFYISIFRKWEFTIRLNRFLNERIKPKEEYPQSQIS